MHRSLCRQKRQFTTTGIDPNYFQFLRAKCFIGATKVVRQSEDSTRKNALLSVSCKTGNERVRWSRCQGLVHSLSLSAQTTSAPDNTFVLILTRRMQSFIRSRHISNVVAGGGPSSFASSYLCACPYKGLGTATPIRTPQVAPRHVAHRAVRVTCPRPVDLDGGSLADVDLIPCAAPPSDRLSRS